jgi:hypothetical protein
VGGGGWGEGEKGKEAEVNVQACLAEVECQELRGK